MKGGALVPLMRGAVHKWNNLLSIISSHAQVALEREGKWTPEEQREEAKILLETVDRAQKINRMIQGILHLQEMETNQGFRCREQVCVGTVLKDLWEILLCEKNGFRYPVQIKAVPQNFTSLSRAAFFISLTWGIEALLEGIPSSAPGTIELDSGDQSGSPVVNVCFFMEKDHLPFPGKPVHFADPFLRFLKSAGIQVEGIEAGFRFILPQVARGEGESGPRQVDRQHGELNQGESGKPLDLSGPPANL